MAINTVVITGATGFIGKALATRLLKEGKKVYAIDIDLKKLKELESVGNVITIQATFERYKELHNEIQDNIDVFYHFAWQGVFGDAFKDYTLQLLNAKYACDAIYLAKSIGTKKFVFAGTNNEYEIKKYLNIEMEKPRYTCIYSTAKLAAEMMCKTIAYNEGVNYSSGLIAMAYGEGNMSKMLPNILIDNLINNRKTSLVQGNNLYDMIYIDDIVEAFYRIGDRGKNLKSYYVGHRNLKKFKEIVIEIRDILNPQAELGFGEYKDSLDMDYSLIDLDALYNDTEFECKSDFKESILKTAKWIEGIGKEDI